MKISSAHVQRGHWGYYGDDENGWEVIGVERESLHLERPDETQRISWAEAADQNWFWWTEK